VYARRARHAKVQKFFGSFFQKRTFFLQPARKIKVAKGGTVSATEAG
jgi:hypothetical protein